MPNAVVATASNVAARNALMELLLSPRGAKYTGVDSRPAARRLEGLYTGGGGFMAFQQVVNVVAACVAVAFGASFSALAQKAKDESPDMKRAREALDKYKDPVMAVHDGYFSTVGCVTYPQPGKPGH